MKGYLNEVEGRLEKVERVLEGGEDDDGDAGIVVDVDGEEEEEKKRADIERLLRDFRHAVLTFVRGE